MKILLFILLFIPVTSYCQFNIGDTIVLKVQDYECGRAGFPRDTAHVVKGGIRFDFKQDGNIKVWSIDRALRFWRKEYTKIIPKELWYEK